MTRNPSLSFVATLFAGVAVSTFASANPAFVWKPLSPNGDPSPQRDTADLFVLDEQTMGFFGGYSEALDISGTTEPSVNVFHNDILLFDAATESWTSLDVPGVKPPARAFGCTVYHEPTNALYTFGGTDFAADFSFFEYFGDQWRFDFDSHTWSDISVPSGPAPSARAAFGCDILGDSIYLFAGSSPGFQVDNELWRYDIFDGSWTLLQAADPSDPGRPRGRAQAIFRRIPGKNQLLSYGGEAFDFIQVPPFVVAIPLDDVWIYDVDHDSWELLDGRNAPSVVREFQAFSMTSSRYFIVQNGDAQGDQTVDETCQPPLVCLIQATPTNDTFVYDLVKEKWKRLPAPARRLPPTKRSAMAKLGDALYLFGGYGWDGTNGVDSEGKIENDRTWKLELRRRFLDD